MMRLQLLFLSFLFVLSCDKNQSISSSELDVNTPPPSVSSSYGFSTDIEALEVIENDDIAFNENFQTPSPKKSTQDQKIIKTARLRFETEDLEKTHTRIMAIIAKSDGYIQHDNTGKDYSQFFRNITVRVPTQNFQATVDAISQGVAYFDEKTISQQDVTEEFVDLNARLNAKRGLENRYLALLAKAKNVKEMLEIERELSSIREQIERSQGRLQYLQNKVSLSTITLSFYKTTVETGITVSYGHKIINSVKNGWNKVSQFFLTLLSSWPFLILVLAVVFFIRRWIRKRKN